MNPDPENTTPQREPVLQDDEKIMAVLAYIPILCLLPYTRKDQSEFVSGHVRLGMTLFIIEIIAVILRFRFIWDLVLLICVISALVGIYHVVMGRGFYLPFLSDLFSRKD
ncbi:hypothetical protein KKG66_10585 [bacterium]|nr:hypothetical protein [bacterium]MBU1921282.1 hypothetical protein [bacterium]